MAAARGLKFEGMDELRAALRDFAPKEVNNLLRNTVHGVAGVVRDGVRKRAPVDTGTLRKAITAVRRRGKPGQPISDVIAKHGDGAKYDAFYWRFLEFGTSKMMARPFIVPTVERFRPEMPRIYREEFGKKFEKAMAKKAKKK